MLHDFTYYNPTKIYFGKDAMNSLPSELNNYGKNVLLLYGKNSIKKIGLYDEVVKILKECGKNVVEFAETSYEDGGYKHMTHADILNVLKECF